MQHPYIHMLGPDSVNFDEHFVRGQGIKYQQIIGAHGIWAATVPFIPALDNEELLQGGSRIGKVVGRHYRFLYDLAREQGDRATYELRFIAHPPAPRHETGRVQIVFLCKVFHPQQSQVKPIALNLWQKFLSNFPLEDPFNYPIMPVTDPTDFQRLYEPVPFVDLHEAHSGCITEIRRYEELPIEVPGEPPSRNKEYIVHPFVPTLDYSAMGRLFETLAVQQTPCMASISVRPVALHDLEVHTFNEMASRLRDIASASSDQASYGKESSVKLEYGEYRRARAEMGANLYRTLMREREFLMQIKVQVVGVPSAPYDLIEALGSEMMNNGRNQFPTKWVRAVPSNAQEFETAKRNLMFLEHDDWGPTIVHPELGRLRTLADVYQAAGAFRLPIPPESGFMPGILVRSEPFVAPQDHLEVDTLRTPARQSVHLGQIHHRGSPTGQQLSLVAQSLTRHGLIAGSTGSGKSTTISSILQQLRYLDTPVPFLVLYPLDKPDYRALLRDTTLQRDLLLFTVGDETVSPFRFNPFAVPEGVLLKTHLSRLMRAFSAAFDLFPPLPMIYREALRAVYRSKGWDILRDRGQDGRTYPTLAEFYAAIEKVAEGLKYSGEVRDTVRQASVIRIGDLLENAGHVLNVQQSPPFAKLLERPVVMELGRIGSQEDITLIMGFLLMLLVETLENRHSPIPHITVVEEAHRLMGRNAQDKQPGTASAAEDFANILAEIRGYNAGLLIAEQIPSQLVHSAMGNTYLKVMHWLEDRESFDQFADIMNLNEQQRAYARRLKPGEAIVRSRFGRPVHIQVEPPVMAGESPAFDDPWLQSTMSQRLRSLGLSIPAWAPSENLAAASRHAAPDAVTVAQRIFDAPFQTHCAFCRPLHETGRCQYEKTTKKVWLQNEGRQLANRTYDILRERELSILDVDALAREAANIAESDHTNEVGYCFLAHLSDALIAGDFGESERRHAALSLKNFPWTKEE